MYALKVLNVSSFLGFPKSWEDQITIIHVPHAYLYYFLLRGFFLDASGSRLSLSPIVALWKQYLWMCSCLASCLCSASFSPCTDLQVLCAAHFPSEAQLQGCCARPRTPAKGEPGMCPALSGHLQSESVHSLCQFILLFPLPAAAPLALLIEKLSNNGNN